MSDGPAALTVDLGERSYDILIGNGLLAGAGKLLAPILAEPRAVVITDENVEEHCLGTLEKSLDETGVDHQSIVLEAGEQTKDFAHVEALWGQLLDHRVERTTTLIALGGGVVGDITGFAAAVMWRRVLATSAEVDVGVGPKLGTMAASVAMILLVWNMIAEVRLD